MDIVADELNIEYDINNKYASIIVSLSSLDEFDIKNIRGIIKNYLYSLDIQYIKINIAKYLLPNVSILEIPQDFIDDRELNELNDFQLLKYLVVVLKTISWVQKDNLLLLKYSNNIWNTGWHNLAKQCRGKVIDWKERSIVSYPFNKFYNLNEVEETKIDIVKHMLSNAKDVMLMDKKDGSAIIVTNHKGNIVINTNGVFENIQVTLTKELFAKKYLNFYQNMPEGYTFVFELVHPENRIVLDYGDTEKLYLLAVRDLKTLKLLRYNEIKEMANKWCLDITEFYDFNTLDELVNKAETECKDIKEGWVIRIITDNEDFMFKLKYAEYFKLSRIKAIPSLKKLYTLLQQEKLDDMLSAAEDDLRAELEIKIQVIYDYLSKIADITEKESNKLLGEYNVEKGNIPTEVLLKIIAEVKGSLLSSYMLKYIKTTDSIDDVFKVLPSTTMFGKLYYYVNEVYNIKEDIWNISEKQVDYEQI